MKPEDRWTQIAPQLRTDAEPEEAPFGFATRVVAAAQLGLPKQSRALLLWRRYSLILAGTTAILLCINTFTAPTQQQFLPLPELDHPTLNTQKP